MAKHANDPGTLDMLPTPKRRGRPPTGQAKTAAERMRAYRQRLASSSLSQRPQTLARTYGCSAPDAAAWEAEREELLAQIDALRYELARSLFYWSAAIDRIPEKGGQVLATKYWISSAEHTQSHWSRAPMFAAAIRSALD